MRRSVTPNDPRDGFFPTRQWSGLVGDQRTETAGFRRLQELSFRHAICGHGPPVRDTAKEAYTATFQRVFGAG